MRGRFKIGDIIVISTILILIAALILCSFLSAGKNASTLVLSQEGKKTYYPLSEDNCFTVRSKGYTLVIEIKKGSVSVISADCPDNTCVHTGKISKDSQIIACVPAGITLTISGEEADYDFVAG